jgi:hypothetical protein
MTASDDDANMARIARDLAAALCVYARERRAEHKLRVNRLQTELCGAWRVENERALREVTMDVE